MIGDNLCRELRLLDDVRPIVRHHHERHDGSGYPDKLSGDQIPLLARIMSIVDAYDAMTTERPYKSAKTPDQACRELREDAARGWRSASLVEEFVTMPQRPCSEPFVASAIGSLRTRDLDRGYLGGLLGNTKPARTTSSTPSVR